MEVLQMIVSAVLMGGMAYLFSFLLDYGLGFPMSPNPNPQSLLFFWTWRLAKKRVKKDNPDLYEYLEDKHLKEKDNPSNLQDIKENSEAERTYRFRRSVVMNGRSLFRHEMMMGMCQVCTNLWVNVFFCIFALPVLFSQGVIKGSVLVFAYPFLQILIGHYLIRKV